MTLQIIQVLAAIVVLAEALNKIERADVWGGRCGLGPRLAALAWLLRPWAWRRPAVVAVFKVAGWFCLSVGAAGAMVTPPAVVQVLVLAGFALLIIRSRLKEG